MDPYTQQQINLLHKLHTNSLSLNEMKSLFFIYFISFLPADLKLKLYFLLNSPAATSNPIIHYIMSLPLPMIILLSLALMGILLFLSVLILSCIYYLLKFLLKMLISKLLKLSAKEEKMLLQVVPPHKTLQSSYATSELFNLLHAASSPTSFWRKFLGIKNTVALELVASREEGIQYFLEIRTTDEEVIKKQLLSFLPGAKISTASDYLPQIASYLEDYQHTKGDESYFKVVEFSLANHFAYPLRSHKVLEEHDPIAYISGMMTKLDKDEIMALQVIVSPLISGEYVKQTEKLENLILNNGDVFAYVKTLNSPLPIKFIKKALTLSLLLFCMIIAPFVFIPFEIVGIVLFLATSEKSGWIIPDLSWIFNRKVKAVSYTSVQQEIVTGMKQKLEQQLFETNIRAFIVVNSKAELALRERGLATTLQTFTNPSWQGLKVKRNMFTKLFLWVFHKLPDRATYSPLGNKLYKAQQGLSKFLNRKFVDSSLVLSVSEVADIYHLPYTNTTKTEGLIKAKSNDLPAPLSFKKSDTNLDVIVGVNEYGGELVPVGVTLEQRRKHMYLIGKTGTGKTELLKNMIYQDMVNGKGLAVLDPHGDLFHELLQIIPKNRRKDVIIFNPADKEYPLGLNILSPGIKFTDEEEGSDWITSATLAIFKKITDKEYWGPRMEHILRNATLTALHTPNPTLRTIQKLLTNKDYQRKVAQTLKDPILKEFWDDEFSKYGNMQLADITSPLTNKLGKFITSMMSRNILLQQSTISIQAIMDEGKILLVNLSKGELGEDQSFFFGTLLTSLIQLAAYQRIHIADSKRADFFLYVDEFQNFATSIYEEIASEGRKFRINLIPSHQNIAQIKDPSTLKVVAGNADTIICLKASPDDEKFILPFMEPEVEKGQIVNLPPFHFFMKVNNDDSEDAFSGITGKLDVEGSEKTAKEVIAYSRKQYGTSRKDVEQYLEKLLAKENTSKETKPTKPAPKGFIRSDKKPIKRRRKSLV